MRTGDWPIVRKLLVGDTIASALPNPVCGHVHVIAVGMLADFCDYFSNSTNARDVEKRGVKRALEDECVEAQDRKLDQVLEQLKGEPSLSAFLPPPL